MIKIKNWDKFQHFKDRRPPWIKLHREILDQRDINLLSDRSFRVLVGLWLLASEDRDKQGGLPSIDDIAFRLRIDKDKIINSLKELDSYLIHDDIKEISEQYQSVPPEEETEAYKQETETKKDLSENLKVCIPIDFELNDTNKDWINKTGMPDLLKLEIFDDFCDYWKIDGSKKTPNGWQMAFRKNPIVKRKITNYLHRSGKQDEENKRPSTSRAKRVVDELDRIAAEDIAENGFTHSLD